MPNCSHCICGGTICIDSAEPLTDYCQHQHAHTNAGHSSDCSALHSFWTDCRRTGRRGRADSHTRSQISLELPCRDVLRLSNEATADQEELRKARGFKACCMGVPSAYSRIGPDLDRQSPKIHRPACAQGSRDEDRCIQCIISHPLT
jgi:hypothetical protein